VATPLGSILDRELDGPRGPDAYHCIRVPTTWLADGAAISVELPRRLACAACRGGGCDACGRSGALLLRAEQAPSERVEVRFGSAPVSGLELRIPDQGAPDAEGRRGHLLLCVCRGETADAGVELLEGGSALDQYRRRELGFPLHRRIQSIVALVLVLSLVFVLILKLARLI
jgi:hypothetical protein